MHSLCGFSSASGKAGNQRPATNGQQPAANNVQRIRNRHKWIQLFQLVWCSELNFKASEQIKIYIFPRYKAPSVTLEIRQQIGPVKINALQLLVWEFAYKSFRAMAKLAQTNWTQP